MNIPRMVLRKLLERAARPYVAGTKCSNAISFAQNIARDGMSSTIAYWNELDEDPLNVYNAYLSAIDGAADAGTDIYISVKAPALAMSEAFACELADRCRTRHVGLHFDSLALEWQGRTLDLVERLIPTGTTLGCTLPARFARSVKDAENAASQGLRVRVVKGQWGDPSHSIEPRLGFMAIIDCLAGRAAHVAVATHDCELAEKALASLIAKGTSTELELLLGLPVNQARNVARRLNVPVRMYVPYGRAWLPYALSQARKNPRILCWVLADALRGRASRTISNL